MSSARIYKPAKDPSQSGMARTKQWVLEFDTQEEAVAYATREGIAYRIEEPKQPLRKGLSYADNFKYNRTAPWTH